MEAHLEEERMCEGQTPKAEPFTSSRSRAVDKGDIYIDVCFCRDRVLQPKFVWLHSEDSGSDVEAYVSAVVCRFSGEGTDK